MTRHRRGRIERIAGTLTAPAAAIILCAAQPTIQAHASPQAPTPVAPQATGATGAIATGATAAPGLPPYRGALRDDYYPPDARLHFRQGRALVEFALDPRGVPTDVVVVNADPAGEFDDAARLLARNLRYQVPPGWGQGDAAHRFRLGVRFQFIECINFSHCEAQARNPPADYDVADRTYIVSAQRRVMALLTQPPVAAPAPGSPAPHAPAPPAATPREEPVYPPG
jgi:TonB family protein